MELNDIAYFNQPVHLYHDTGLLSLYCFAYLRNVWMNCKEIMT